MSNHKVLVTGIILMWVLGCGVTEKKPIVWYNITIDCPHYKEEFVGMSIWTAWNLHKKGGAQVFIPKDCVVEMNPI